MTCNHLTEVILVLDRSGSMQAIRDATIKACNGYMSSLNSGEGEVRWTLVQFDHECLPFLLNEPIGQVQPLTTDTYVPRGTTALYDAIGKTIDETGQRYAQLPEGERPGTVIFVIQTDGLENSSQLFTARKINEMIAEQSAKYAWQFVFLGANQDAIASAGQVGIAPGAALSYDGNAICTQAAFGALARCTSEYRRRRARAPHSAVQWEFSPEARVAAKKS